MIYINGISRPQIKSAVVTDTTGVDGKVAVSFAEAFASTPMVIVQLENDVDYYPVVTAKSTTGFTVKILKTAHAHSQGNTGSEASHTHGISFTSGAGSSHRHSNPNTSAVSAGTPSGAISYDGLHNHAISLTSGAGSPHKHTQGVTGAPSAYDSFYGIDSQSLKYCAETSGGSPTFQFYAPVTVSTVSLATHSHTHTNPDTATESTHTHSISGSTETTPTHTHIFTGSALETHYHTIGNTSYESAHTHPVSGTSGAGSSHAHSNPNTDSANAGNALASTSVTFSYIAMVP